MDSKVANNESVKGNSANRFDKSKVYILDGDVSLALGSRLGFQDTTRDKCWPASALKDAPAAVSETHCGFIRSGANIVRTITAKADIRKMRANMMFKDPAVDPFLLIETAPKVAKIGIDMARGKSCLIAGSIGPWIGCGHPPLSNELSPSEAREKLSAWHEDRIKRLTVGGVTLFAVESMPGSTEALAVLDVLEKIPGSRCWMSFKCRSGGSETASGEALDQAFLKTADHPGFRFKVLAVGVDSVATEDITPALKILNKVNHWSRFPGILNYEKVPYVVCPNSQDPESKEIHKILDRVREWMGLGANVIGGGEGVSPLGIRAISQRVFMEVFDAMEERAQREDKDRNTRDEWAQVDERLKKQPYDELKEKKTSQAFDRFGEGSNGAFSRIHHQVEQSILEKQTLT